MSGEKDLFEQIAVGLATKIEAHIETRLNVMVAEAFKSNLKVIFDEEEGAAFLKVSTDTLASWRKRNLLEYAKYPVSRIRKEGDEGKLSDMVTYDLAALLSFRAKYIIKAVTPNKYELVPRFSVVGPAIDEVKKAAAA